VQTGRATERLVVAKLPHTGQRYQFLDERKRTLADVVAGLGLKPLSEKAERTIRDRLGHALAQRDEPYGPDVKDIARILDSFANGLEKAVPVMAVSKGGLHGVEEIEAATRLAQSLREKSSIGSIGAAHQFLADFGERASIVASASRSAARKLGEIRGTGGGSPYGWYDQFTAVRVDICRSNGLEPKARIDRISGEVAGDLARMAAEFEQLLPEGLRSRTYEAMVKRLKRSLRRLCQTSN
jgi:hypothetical protein